jgi:putative DNA primase/helicase
MSSPALDYLHQLPRWVLWRWETAKNGERTKPPFTIHGFKASHSKPGDWSSHAAVTAMMARCNGTFDGCGIVLGDTGASEILAGIDLDSCLEDGALTDWAIPYFQVLQTYAEISPSGTGLKLLFRIRAL